MKSTVEEIRQFFDADVERFSNLETGQTATMDAPLAMQLVAQAAAATTPNAQSILDVGCGAGNYSLKLLQQLPDRDVTLVDLSQNMLQRAVERVSAATKGRVTPIQSDIRELQLGESKFDIIVASAVLHHLRTDEEWTAVFKSFYQALRPNGSIWIFDLVESSIAPVQALLWKRWGEYLSALQGDEYRDGVFQHVEMEDTPRPLFYQLDLLRQVGFSDVEVLHKISCFAAFGALKAR